MSFCAWSSCILSWLVNPFAAPGVIIVVYAHAPVASSNAYDLPSLPAPGSVPLLLTNVIEAVAILRDADAFLGQLRLLLLVALVTGVFSGLRGGSCDLAGARFGARLRQRLLESLLQQEVQRGLRPAAACAVFVRRWCAVRARALCALAPVALVLRGPLP